MFNSLHEFINDLTTKNIFDDKKLMELAKIAKDSISGISPYGLNYNDQMKNRIKVSMKTLNDAINDSIEELPKRKIRLATKRVQKIFLTCSFFPNASRIAFASTTMA